MKSAPGGTVLIHKRTGIFRVSGGETPIIEIDLAPGQYITNVELTPRSLVFSDRETVDWDWAAYVVTPFPATPQRKADA